MEFDNLNNFNNMDLKNFDFGKKINLHPEQLVKLKKNQRPFPVTMEVDLTNYCNHNCSFCCWGEDIATDKSTLKTNVIKKCIKDMKMLGTKALTFTGGGEPMIHKDFYKVLAYANKNKLDCGLITNGSAITKERCHILFENLQWIRISVSGGDAASYLKVQGKDHFERVLKNISILSDTKKKIKSNTKIGVRLLLTEENLYTITTLAERIKKIAEINYLQISPNQFSSDEGKFWHSARVSNEIEKVKKILKNTKMNLLTSSFEILNTSKEKRKGIVDFPKKCYAHFFQGTIMADGNVAFCKDSRFSKKYTVGNINTKTIKEIWNSKKFLEIEKWIKPSNCGLICKSITVNLGVQEVMSPDKSIDPNFIG